MHLWDHNLALFRGTDAVTGRVSRTNKETLTPSLSQEHKRSCAWVREEKARENSFNLALEKLADMVCCEALPNVIYMGTRGMSSAQSCNPGMLIKYSILFSIAMTKILKTFE